MPVLQPQGSHFGLILPLCTSSATVGMSLFQYPVFFGFLSQPGNAGKPLSRFWDGMIKPGASLIAAIAITSSVAGFSSARWLHTHATLETTSVSRWYTYGAMLAAGHLAFGPLVIGPIRRMIEAGQSSTLSEEDVERKNRVEMKSWLTVHTARTILVDLPALLCFAEGAALSFWVI